MWGFAFEHDGNMNLHRIALGKGVLQFDLSNLLYGDDDLSVQF